MKPWSRVWLLAAACPIAALPVAALAQDAAPASEGVPTTGTNATDSGDIIVTAQRRSERLQDVPISITSLSSDKLEQANVQTLSDIVKLTPALRFDYASAFVQPTIRGVGNAVVTAGGGSNVGIYIDGFYSPNPLAGDFQLLSVSGVQVLKGPQGTLFGRNTTGGAILVTTSDPSFETKGAMEVSYGSFNTAQFDGYFSSGLTDRIAFDAAGSYRRSDGYVHNIVADGPQDPGRLANWSVRAGLKFDVSSGFSLLARYAHQHMSDATNVAYGLLDRDGVTYAVRPIVANPSAPGGLSSVSLPANLLPTGYLQTAVNPGDQPNFRFDSDIYQLTGKLDVNFANLTSYTQYRRETSTVTSDMDQTAADILFERVPVLDRTFTQELLLTSKPGSHLQWTAGAFYFNYVDLFANSDGPIVAGTDSSFDPPFYEIITHARSQSIAGYADLTDELLPSLFVTVGARYSHDDFDRASFQFLPAPPTIVGTISGNAVTPRAVVRYQIDPRSSVYASYTRGYKASLIDVINNGPVKPEKMDAFEVGYKYASRKFSLSLASWYYNYRDLQTSVYIDGLSKVLNAANARIYGVEAEGHYAVTPNLELSTSGSYVDAKYTSFPQAANFQLCSTVQPIATCGSLDEYQLVGLNAAGYQMQRAPKLTATASARYGFNVAGGRAALSGNFYHSSKFYFDFAEQFPQKAYNLVGLRLEWTDRSGSWTLAAYGDNIFGTKYLTQIISHSTGIGTIWGEPASWGLSAKFRFGK